MKKIVLKASVTLAAFLIVFSSVKTEGAEGDLIFAGDFSNVPEPRKMVKVAEGVTRKAVFGKWELVGKNTLRATNIPEDNHGPVLIYEMDVDNAVLSCEFKLPVDDVVGRHFRIFLDHGDYGGHMVNGVANISSVFRPVGLTLQHLQKGQDKKVVQNIEFGQKALDLKPGEWHKMTIKLIDDHAWIDIDGKVSIVGRSEWLYDTKAKIGLNPGLAGGEIRNFRITTPTPTPTPE